MLRSTPCCVLAFLLLLIVTSVSADGAPRGADGELQIKIVDSETHEPIPARLHLKNSRRRPVKLRLPGVVEFGDHSYIDGQASLPLRTGQYTFELEATPEYRTQSGHFEIQSRADDETTIEMRRFANLAEEGWWGGDLDVSHRLADLPLAMRAEGLAIVPTRAAAADANSVSESLAQPDERLGGGLLIFNLPKSFDLLGSSASAKLSSLDVLREAKELGAIAIARSPLEWDLPVWLASGQLDAIELIDSHSLREGATDDDGTDRPRDKSVYSGPAGRSRWGEAIYYHVLNCGLRIPPVAGSGSGTNDSPLGTNRVYVHCGDNFSNERWWEGLVAGRVFVTNGPLLRPLVAGQPPGYVFHLDGGRPASLEIGLNLATRVPIEYLQIVQNGQVVSEIRLDEFADSGGRLPPVVVDDSGWFLVRAVTNDSRKHQFAASGPFYAEKAGRPRVSRRSVQFFLDCISASEQRLRDERGLDDATRDNLLAEQGMAREFFEKRLATANVE